MFIGFMLFNDTTSSSSSSSSDTSIWYPWRVYYLIPVPFMIISLVIFVKFAFKETIEYYVKAGEDHKEDAKLLMQQVIQKKAKKKTLEA